jgi:hypothetical protein
MPNLPISQLPHVTATSANDIIPIVQGGITSYIKFSEFTQSLATLNSNVFVGTQTVTGSLRTSGSSTLIGQNTISGAFYIASSSLFYNNTGSSLVAYDTTTGQLFHTTYQSALPALFSAGGFYATSSQFATANVSGAFVYDTSLGINSVHLNHSSSHIVVDKAATYNIQFSIQIQQGAGSVDLAVWLKKNDINVPNTTTYITIPSNQKSFFALNLWDTANANDFYEIAYQSSGPNTSFPYIAATGNIPACPSIIVTLNQVR